MIGLIKKDLLMTIGNLKTLGIIFVAFTLMAINGNGNLVFVPALISIMTMITTFSYDEYNKSDAYISTLPKGKRNAVRSKYISTLIIALSSLILTFLMSIIIELTKNHIEVEGIVSSTVGCGVGVILFQSVSYPFIYKYGVEKGRIAIFVGIFAVSIIASVLMKNGISNSVPENVITILNNYWIMIIPIVMVTVLWISYKISEHIYIKKEF